MHGDSRHTFLCFFDETARLVDDDAVNAVFHETGGYDVRDAGVFDANKNARGQPSSGREHPTTLAPCASLRACGVFDILSARV